MRGPPDLLTWRQEFPAVDARVFLGVHTLAPLSRRVRARVEHFLDVWQEKASAELVWFEDVIPEMRRLESLYARLIGADADEVALTPSVSAGLSSIASAFSFHERAEVVISRDEFPTDCHVWLAQERRGARVRWVDGRAESAFVSAVSDRTRAVSVSRVSYLDGAAIDVATLGAACADVGAHLVVDDYHGSGVLPLDVRSTGASALVGGPLKYLLGGPGVAFLYVRREVVPTLAPTVTGWFSQADFFAFDNTQLAWPDTAQRFAMGTPAPAAIFAAAEGLQIVLEVGMDRIRTRVSELTRYVIQRAHDEGLVVRSPLEDTRRGGLVALEVDDAAAVLHHLLARGVVLDERHGALRVSPHFYSSEDDVDAFFDVLLGLLR